VKEVRNGRNQRQAVAVRNERDPVRETQETNLVAVNSRKRICSVPGSAAVSRTPGRKIYALPGTQDSHGEDE